MIVTEPHVFLSYHRTDLAVAERVRAHLLANGVKTWMDHYDIPAGAYWPDEIDQGLSSRDLVVGMLSPDAVASRNVKNEWDWAIQNDKPLILLMIATLRDPAPLRLDQLHRRDQARAGRRARRALMRTPGCGRAQPRSFVAAPRPRTCAAATSTLPIRSLATATSTSSTCRAPSPTSSSWEAPRDGRIPARIGVVFAGHPRRQAWHGHVRSPARIASLEERMDDIWAVMDACQSERAVIFGVSGEQLVVVLLVPSVRHLLHHNERRRRPASRER